MEKNKIRALKKGGWVVEEGPQDFLKISEAEMAVIDARVALAAELQQWRKRKRLTQAKLAHKIGSSQSRVAKMEAADPSVSLELLIKGLAALGAHVSVTAT